MDPQFIIEDTRHLEDFKDKSFAGFKKTDVLKTLFKSIESGKVENACHWTTECMISGYCMELIDKVIAQSSKLIHINKGYQSSLQWHEKKVETNYVIEGEAEVLLENKNGEMESRKYKPGKGFCVPLKTKHRVIATKDLTMLECSTAHLNDCIRFEDEYDRDSGKINSEHEGN